MHFSLEKVYETESPVSPISWVQVCGVGCEGSALNTMAAVETAQTNHSRVADAGTAHREDFRPAVEEGKE